jgi:hypothetical protein
MYENEQRFDAEFAQNLTECQKEFAQFFAENKNETVSVAAPGI